MATQGKAAKSASGASMSKYDVKKWTQSFVWKLYNRAMTEDVITGDSVIANDFRNAYCKNEIDFKNGERSYNLS